jgi:fatty acyl-CoA reductase
MAAEVVITDGSENMLPSIVDFYSARDVFITGATGFMGKCLLEKLLRSVPDLGSVFVLTRAKKGKSPEQRTKELLSSPLFERLRSEQPGAVDKVVPVFGDIQEKQLGMRREDQEMLQDRVSIVFHLAATVRFESPLRYRSYLSHLCQFLKLAKYSVSFLFIALVCVAQRGADKERGVCQRTHHSLSRNETPQVYGPCVLGLLPVQ